jgi:hypothetical protein
MEPKDLTLLDLLTHMGRRGRGILWLALGAGFLVYWSSWLDLYILARTVWVVLTRKGAY